LGLKVGERRRSKKKGGKTKGEFRENSKGDQGAGSNWIRRGKGSNRENSVREIRQ